MFDNTREVSAHGSSWGILLLVGSVLVGAACVPIGGQPAQSTAAVTPATPTAARPSVVLVSIPGSLPATIMPAVTPLGSPTLLPASIVDPIIADAAARTGIATSQITIFISEQAAWPDRGLGCPQPGVAYTQVPVDGYRLVVNAGGQLLDYRGGAGIFRLCEK